MDNIIQFTSLIAVATLLYITFYLSQKQKVHVFIVVGQDVFRWLSFVLGTILLVRICISLHLLNSTESRLLNSMVFFVAVFGIVWSVLRHGKPQ